MISLSIVILLLVCHFVGDFLLQTDRMALNKSKDRDALLDHTLTYSAVFILPMLIVFGTQYTEALALFYGFTFFLFTFVLHTTIDHFTSRLNAKLWQKESKRWFFVSIGFDQMTHVMQLLLTYYFLAK